MTEDGRESLAWPGGRLDFSGPTLVMGILNITPDSFSDGGLFLEPGNAIEHGRRMAEQGAAIIDIGAESSRPGSKPVTTEEQLARTVPVISELAKSIDVPISIDTADATVAEAALDAGAAIVNDITACRDQRMVELVRKRSVPVVIMHMQGTPATMQQNPSYRDVVGEVRDFLLGRAAELEAAGIPGRHIIIDPGIGFGKTFEHNLQLIRHLSAFTQTPYRVLLGPSRKRFLSHITGHPTEKLGPATAAVVAFAALAGTAIVRVHDVAQMVDVVKTINAVGRDR